MRPTAAPADPVRRAAHSIAARVGVTTAVVVLVAIIGAGFLFDRQQAADIRRQVDASAATVDDVVDAPVGIWLVQVAPDGTRSTTGTPAPVAAAAEAALRSVPSGTEGTPDGTGQNRSFPLVVVADGRDWPAAGVKRDDRLFAAVYDVRLHATQERSLLVAMGVAGLLGVVLSALTGLLAGRRAVRPLAEALDLQRQFIADASHELRTPLAVISTRAQLLRRSIRAQRAATDSGVGGAMGREVDQLVDDTKAMGEVLSDLLLSAQLDAGEAPRDLVDVAGLARDVVISLRPYAAESGVALEWRGVVAGGGPSGGSGRGDASRVGGVDGDRGEALVEGVSTSLRRAILALVDNAVAHSGPGAAVELAARTDGGQVRLEVVDHGPGVAADELEALTRRFARARRDTPDRRFGLGLALVTQIVRHHGGSLEVTPTHGGGATFTLALPASTRR
ncbi:sensor histidine kinase [Terrabacter sp. 2RAF25]|uniref:sensor histidine kinase n=1 Tax=Terrabacter sp. 2RAF25 TaxID=3232998 RepID=UPI003F96D579